MATKPTIQLPDLPADWFQSVTGAPAVRDPINGAPYFFNWPPYDGDPANAPGKSFQKMLGDDLIAPVYPPRVTGTNNYLFNRNPYPPNK